MGARGPAPKPTAIKEAAGNPGRRQLNDNEPVPPPTPASGIPPPVRLAKDARAIWDELAPICIGMRTLTVADRLTFARYCTAYARYQELEDFCWRKGATGTTYALKDQKGKVRCMMETPQAAELRKMHEILLRMEIQFGLTPAARSRINVGSMPSPAPAPEPAKQKPLSNGGPINIQDFIALGGAKPRPGA